MSHCDSFLHHFVPRYSVPRNQSTPAACCCSPSYERGEGKIWKTQEGTKNHFHSSRNVVNMLYTFSHFKSDFTKVSLWNITQRIIHSVRFNSDSVAFEFLDKSSHLLRKIATVSSSNNRVNVQEYEHLPGWKNWEATFWKDKCYLQAQGRERRQWTNWKKSEASKYGKH